MTQSMAIAIAFFLGAAIFLFALLIVIWQYDSSSVQRNNKGDWLFHDFYLKVYSALFENKDPDEVATMFGIEADKYYKSCRITSTKPDMKHVIVNHVYGIAILIVCLLLGITASIWFLVPGVIGFMVLMFYDQNSLDNRAQAMNNEIEDELPGFLDLLKPALEIGMPVDQAIESICTKLDNNNNLLAFELSSAMEETKMGAMTWDEAIVQVADKYDVDSLKDFALDLVMSYNKGVSVTESVEEKTTEVRQSHLLKMREKASQLSNSILLPIMGLQFVPMIAFIMVPLIVMVMEEFE